MQHTALRKAERMALKAEIRAALEAERTRIAERILMAAQNGRQPLTAEAVLAAAGVQVIATGPPTWLQMTSWPCFSLLSGFLSQGDVDCMYIIAGKP